MTVIILSHDALLAERIASGLAMHCPSADVIGRCYTTEAGIKACMALRPDAVILDLDMPNVQRDFWTVFTSAGFRVIAISANPALKRKLQDQFPIILTPDPLDPVLLAQLLYPS
jgi:DNA-binding NarL/FixJ family response regulator